MPSQSLIASTVAAVLILSCMIGRSQAWIRREIESVNNNSERAFRLRTSRRMKKSKSSKGAKSGKSSKGSHSHYGYHYHNAGFLDEDIATDFEDMFGNIVTADHFSYPNYHPRHSSKSGKSSKSEGYYYLSYPIHGGKGQKGGKGAKTGKHEKLPYYESDYLVGSKSEKDTKLRPPKLTRPPSSATLGPPGGPPALQDSPDEVDGPESAAPTALDTIGPPSTPTPTSSEPGAPTEDSEEPTATPGMDLNMTEAPTASPGNETDVNGTKSLTGVPVAFSLYSLTYTLEDNVMPTREEDFAELTKVTRNTFSDYMERYFADYPLTIQTGFSTEFVRTGTNMENKLFVVFQSTVFFDSSSFMVPEASQVEAVLQEGLAKNDLLWMEYIDALQEMDEANAFSSTIGVVYSDTPPPVPIPRTSVGDSSSAVAAIAAAAAGVTVIAIGLFVMKRKRQAALLLDDGLSPEKRMRPTRSLFRRDEKDDSDTESNTFGESSFGLQTVPLTSTVGTAAEIDEETGSVGNDSTVYTSGDRSSKVDDWQRYKAFSYEKDESDDDCSEYSDDAIASKSSESSEGKARIDEKSKRSSRPWHVPDNTKEKTFREGELTERQRNGKSSAKSVNPDEEAMRQKKEQLCQERLEIEAQRRSQEEAQKLEEKKLAVERAALEDWLRKEKVARLDEEKRLSEEKLQAELAKIKAEKAALAAQWLRQKEESQFFAEKRAYETKLKQQEKARQYEEQKLAKAKREFEVMIQREKQEREALELRLLEEKKAADEALRKAEKRAQRAEDRIKKEKRKLKEAKEAMEAKQKHNEQVGDANKFLEEEEVYLRQLRSAEQAREENLKASKEAARAVDIHKLQQLRFQEKEKDLDLLRLKEAKAAESAESIVKARLSPEESKIWDQAKGMLRVSSPSTDEGENQYQRKMKNCDRTLEMALRLAQSWGDAPASSGVEEAKIRQVKSWDSASPSRSDRGVESDEERYNQSGDDCQHKMVDTEDEFSDVEEPPSDSEEEKPLTSQNKSNIAATSECASNSTASGADHDQTKIELSNSNLPESVRKAAKQLKRDDEWVLPKIGAAQFIAPWKDDDGSRDEKRKSRRSRHKPVQSARNTRAREECDESMYSESNGSSSQNDGGTTVTSASVDDEDTCSEFSIRTNTTLSSGLSKILPR